MHDDRLVAKANGGFFMKAREDPPARMLSIIRARVGFSLVYYAHELF